MIANASSVSARIDHIRGRNRSAATANNEPANISNAIPRGVPSVNNPTNSPLVAPRANWATPMTAAAEPACAAWRPNAPAVTLPLLEALTTQRQKYRRHDHPQYVHTWLKLSTSNSVVAASDTRQMKRSMNDSPNRGSRRALICDPAISPQEHRPKISPNPTVTNRIPE